MNDLGFLGTWIERGRGTLRLNDKQLENEALQSRLIMRTQGSLRVILNTKVRFPFRLFSDHFTDTCFSLRSISPFRFGLI